MTSRDQDDSRQIEALFRRYIEAWNARDFNCIAHEVYRTPVPVFDTGATSTLETPEAIVNLLSGLRSELDGAGFTHSELVDVSQCNLGGGLAFASFHYRRFNSRDPDAGKEVLSSAYILRRYADGWRCVAHVVQPQVSRLRCMPGSTNT